VLGLAVLGAVCGRGKLRTVWLGASLFGVGYMILAFGRPPSTETWSALPTDHFLNALRPWFAPVATGRFISSADVARDNAHILKALDQRVPMRFPIETPLEDVLKHIKDATRGPDGWELPIFLDPVGLQEEERSLTSPIILDLDGVPLRTTLRLGLQQLGLDYTVVDGVLVIHSQEEGRPVALDPFLIAGHCLLALLAAVVGGVAAPLVTDRREQSRAQVTVA
jgi:hypothetical protein